LNVKRSLYSLIAGCLVALLVNSFTARPLLGAIFQSQRFEQAAISESMSISDSLGEPFESAGATRLALKAAGK